jgi:hypothetical protein
MPQPAFNLAHQILRGRTTSLTILEMRPGRIRIEQLPAAETALGCGSLGCAGCETFSQRPAILSKTFLAIQSIWRVVPSRIRASSPCDPLSRT